MLCGCAAGIKLAGRSPFIESSRRGLDAHNHKSPAAGIKAGERGVAMDTRTSIAPMLSVRRGASAIEFYKAAFGAGELFRLDSESGAVVARLVADGAEF